MGAGASTVDGPTPSADDVGKWSKEEVGEQVAAIGDAAGIELYGGTMLEGAIGTIASAHAFATFRELQWGTELFGPLLLTEEILAEPLQYQDFQLAIPNRPGLGIVLDEERVQYFRRDRKQGATVTAARPATLAG